MQQIVPVNKNTDIACQYKCILHEQKDSSLV